MSVFSSRKDVERTFQQWLMPTQTLHPTFHFPGDVSGRHATPRDTMWLMLFEFPDEVSKGMRNRSWSAAHEPSL